MRVRAVIMMHILSVYTLASTKKLIFSLFANTSSEMGSEPVLSNLWDVFGPRDNKLACFRQAKLYVLAF